MLRFPHQKEAENDDGPKDIGQDEDMLTVIAVCYHPGYGANHKGGQHAHDKEPAHREAGLAQFCNQGG